MHLTRNSSFALWRSFVVKALDTGELESELEFLSHDKFLYILKELLLDLNPPKSINASLTPKLNILHSLTRFVAAIFLDYIGNLS